MKGTYFITFFISILSFILAKAEGVHFYHEDQRGSATVVTDSSGKVVEAIRYTPFGEIASAKPLSEAVSHLYTDQEFDRSTDLYSYGARCYDPVLSRFMSVDPIRNEMNPQDLNLYSYAWNNPLRITDPSGMQEEESEPLQNQSEEGSMGEEIPWWVEFQVRLVVEPPWALAKLAAWVRDPIDEHIPFSYSPAVRAYKGVKQLHPGMEEQRVVEIMGYPTAMYIYRSSFPQEEMDCSLHLDKEEGTYRLFYRWGESLKILGPFSLEEIQSQVFHPGTEGWVSYFYPRRDPFREAPEVILDRKTGLVKEVHYKEEHDRWWDNEEEKEQQVRQFAIFMMRGG